MESGDQTATTPVATILPDAVYDQDEFSVGATELLQKFRGALKARTHTVGVQTRVSDVMEAMDTLQAQKDTLTLELQQARQDLQQSQMKRKAMEIKYREQLESAEEKIERFRTRTQAIENMVVLRRHKNAQDVIGGVHPGAPSPGHQVAPQDTLPFTARTKIAMLEKSLVNQNMLEDKIMHLEKRLVAVAGERGQERLKLKQLENDCEDAHQQREFCLAQQRLARQQCEDVKGQLEKLTEEHAVLRSNNIKHVEESAALKTALSNAVSLHKAREAHLDRKWKQTTRFLLQSREEFGRYRTHTAQLQTEFLAIQKQMVRVHGHLQCFPRIGQLRRRIIASVEHAKERLVHFETQRLEKTFKRNIVKQQQLAVQNDELSRMLKQKNMELERIHEAHMKTRVDMEVQGKLLVDAQENAHKLHAKIVTETKQETDWAAKVEELQKQKRGMEIEMHELMIRNDLMNKLLTSERENNGKFQEIVMNTRPEIQRLRLTEKEAQEENQRLKLQLANLKVDLEMKTKECHDYVRENTRLANDAKHIKSALRQKLDGIFNESERLLSGMNEASSESSGN